MSFSLDFCFNYLIISTISLNWRLKLEFEFFYLSCVFDCHNLFLLFNLIVLFIHFLSLIFKIIPFLFQCFFHFLLFFQLFRLNLLHSLLKMPLLVLKVLSNLITMIIFAINYKIRLFLHESTLLHLRGIRLRVILKKQYITFFAKKYVVASFLLLEKFGKSLKNQISALAVIIKLICSFSRLAFSFLKEGLITID